MDIFFLPWDLCRMPLLTTSPSNRLTWAQGPLWLEPTLWDQWARAQLNLDWTTRYSPALELQYISVAQHFILSLWVPNDQVFTSNSNDLAHTISQTPGYRTRPRAPSSLLTVRQSLEENKYCLILSEFLSQHSGNPALQPILFNQHISKPLSSVIC